MKKRQEKLSKRLLNRISIEQDFLLSIKGLLIFNLPQELKYLCVPREFDLMSKHIFRLHVQDIAGVLMAEGL